MCVLLRTKILSLLNNFAEDQFYVKWFELVLCIILVRLLIIGLGDYLVVVNPEFILVASLNQKKKGGGLSVAETCYILIWFT